MAEEKGFENGRNSNFQGLVTLTLTLVPAIRHTVVYHSSTSRTDGRTDGRTFSPPLILLGRLLEVDLKRMLKTTFRCLLVCETQGSCTGLEFKASLEKFLNFIKLKMSLNCFGKPVEGLEKWNLPM